MADTALFIGWGNPVRGREKAAVTVFNESVQYWTQLQQNGQIESLEIALLEPHGGDLGGFALLRGTADQLAAVRASQEFQRAVTRASLIVENLGVVHANLGQALAGQMAMYQEEIGKLV
jgi:hypothetical protein